MDIKNIWGIGHLILHFYKLHLFYVIFISNLVRTLKLRSNHLAFFCNNKCEKHTVAIKGANKFKTGTVYKKHIRHPKA